MLEWDLERLPTKKEAVESVVLVTRVPAVQWHLIHLYGLYIQEWEKKFDGQWKMTVYGSKEVIHILRQLVVSHGMDFAVGAVRTVFEISWITAAHDRFLGNPNNITRFIIPEMAKKKVRGEQAEWTGPREDASGTSVDSKQFFGKGNK